MTEQIVTHLFNTFYKTGKPGTDNDQASEHWKQFSRNFQVETDAAGNIHTIKGYGFGGSDDKRVLAKITAAFGNALILSKLNYPGLKEEVSAAKKTVASMGLSFSQDALRQVCTSYFIGEKTKQNNTSLQNILIIGDGHGILAALLSKKFPDAKIYLIDLGVTLFFQAYYLGKTFPGRSHTLLGFSDDTDAANGFFYCPAESLQNFPDVKIDLAINIASMQEMTMDVVDNYFSLLREHKTDLFYCCNRLEKKLPDGKIIRFMEYPWKKEDLHLVDEKCPWHQFFVGRSASDHVKLMNILPVPLMHRYDGVHWHRLTKLSY